MSIYVYNVYLSTESIYLQCISIYGVCNIQLNRSTFYCISMSINSSYIQYPVKSVYMVYIRMYCKLYHSIFLFIEYCAYLLGLSIKWISVFSVIIYIQFTVSIFLQYLQYISTSSVFCSIVYFWCLHFLQYCLRYCLQYQSTVQYSIVQFSIVYSTYLFTICLQHIAYCMYSVFIY